VLDGLASLGVPGRSLLLGPPVGLGGQPSQPIILLAFRSGHPRRHAVVGLPADPLDLLIRLAGNPYRLLGPALGFFGHG
jgi:hypothetical protein